MPWYRLPIRVANRRAELLIDPRFRDTAPIRDLPELHRVAVGCRLPALRPAFVAPEEEPTIIALERKLIEIAGRTSNGWAVYLMRILSQGLVEFYFYGRDSSSLTGVTAELQHAFPDYQLEHESRPDPAWELYLSNCSSLIV